MKIKKFFLGLAAAALLALALPAAALPVSVSVTIYPLTNSLAGTTNYIAITNGSLTLSSNQTYVVTSQPFQIWRGRGFAFNTQFVCTNAQNSVLTFNFRFATVHSTNWTTGLGLVTNWCTANQLAIGATGNGTTVVNLATNIPPAIVDNYQLGQLYSIGVSTIPTATLLDPTNTFIGVYP
jgi:hypothetical protein